MAFTYANLVDLARIPLNDADKARYSDDELMKYANQAMLQAYRSRPDVFIGRFDSPPEGEDKLEDLFPLPAYYVQVLADYVTARAEMIDDEHANSGRAATFMQLFGSEMPA